MSRCFRLRPRMNGATVARLPRSMEMAITCKSLQPAVSCSQPRSGNSVRHAGHQVAPILTSTTFPRKEPKVVTAPSPVFDELFRWSQEHGFPTGPQPKTSPEKDKG